MKLFIKKKLKKYRLYSCNNEKTLVFFKKKINFTYYSVLKKTPPATNFFFLVNFLNHSNIFHNSSFSLLLKDNNKLILNYSLLFFLTLIKKLFKINFDFELKKKK